MSKRPGHQKQDARHAPPRRDQEQQRPHADSVVLVRVPDPGDRSRAVAAPWRAIDRDIQDRYSR